MGSEVDRSSGTAGRTGPGESGDRPFRLGRAAPSLGVRDLDAALGFWAGVLGMREVFRNGDPVRIVVLEGGDAEVHLVPDPTHRATERIALHLLVDDADALWEQVRRHGVTVVSEVRDADYGMRTFVVADPDGNRVDVGAYLPPAAPGPVH